MAQWVFGYGSLVWKPDLPFTDEKDCYVKGWARRFWQGSPDHRGTPEAEGRVCTLLPIDQVVEHESRFEDQVSNLPDENNVVWGKAFLVPEKELTEVLAKLDHREKAGYSKKTVLVHPTGDEEPFEALVFYSTLDNPHFIGPSPLPEMAEHVERSHGPSGSNVEYVQNLFHALVEMSDRLEQPCVDSHLASLIDALENIHKQDQQQS